MAETAAERFEGWAILELMGHSKSAGYVKTVELAGHGMLRVDVPGENGDVNRTEYFSPGALYALRPVSEEFARLTAREMARPISTYGLDSVFGSMSVVELERFGERLGDMIKSRQLTAGEGVKADTPQPHADEQSELDDVNGWDDLN